jgi:hypothetical protein
MDKLHSQWTGCQHIKEVSLYIVSLVLLWLLLRDNSDIEHK